MVMIKQAYHCSFGLMKSFNQNRRSHTCNYTKQKSIRSSQIFRLYNKNRYTDPLAYLNSYWKKNSLQ